MNDWLPIIILIIIISSSSSGNICVCMHLPDSFVITADSAQLETKSHSVDKQKVVTAVAV